MIGKSALVGGIVSTGLLASAISSFDKPEYAFATGTSSPSCHTPKV